MVQEKQTADILFKGGDLITLDATQPYIRNGALAVVGNKILAIGKMAEVEERLTTAKRTIDCSGLTMMPGMVDGHTHLFQSLGKTLGDGMSLLPWLAKFMMPLSANISSTDAVHAVRLQALHGLLSGTTTLVDNHYAPVDAVTTIEVAAAMAEVGVEGGCGTGHIWAHGRGWFAYEIATSACFSTPVRKSWK